MLLLYSPPRLSPCPPRLFLHLSLCLSPRLPPSPPVSPSPSLPLPPPSLPPVSPMSSADVTGKCSGSRGRGQETEVPLGKDPNPQMPTFGPVMNWGLIRGGWPLSHGAGVHQWGCLPVAAVDGKCLVSLQGEDRAALSPTGKRSPADSTLGFFIQPISHLLTPFQGVWPPVARPV